MTCAEGYIPVPKEHRNAPTLLQLLLLNAIVCGNELCVSAGFTYLPPMLLKAGIEDQYMSIILSIGPLIAFFVVPLIARSSDNCRSRFGRRRPFILALGVCVLIALILVPYGDVFGFYLFHSSKLSGVLLLVFGTILLDFASQACLMPCEALLADVSRNSGSGERAFMVYSFMASFGGCIGYLITALDWSTSPVAALFGGQEKTCFSILFFLFTLAMSASLLTAHESSFEVKPGQNLSIHVHDMNGAATGHASTEMTNIVGANINNKYDLGYESYSEDGDTSIEKSPQKPSHASDLKNKTATEKSWIRPYIPTSLIAERCGVPFPSRLLSRLASVARYMGSYLYLKLPWTIRNMIEAPDVLKRLTLADFFSWSALLCYNIFYSDFVGQHVYNGDPNAPEGSTARTAYDYGVRISSWGLLLHCLLAAICAAFVEKLIHRIGPKRTFFFGTFSFTIALTVMASSTNIFIVNFMSTITGFTMTVLTTIPLTLITMYQEEKEIYYYDITSPSSRGTATDISVLDSSYFLAEILLTMVVGYIEHLSGTVTAYMVCSAILGGGACYFLTRVIFSRQEMNAYLRKQQMKEAKVSRSEPMTLTA